MTKIYEDTQIIIYVDKIEIKKYYFPVGKSKYINFSEIKYIKLVELNVFNGNGRLWGMSLAPYWYNLDKKRLLGERTKSIIINLGKLINPAITPDNYEQVFDILKKKIP